MKIVYDGALFPGVGGGPRHFIGLSNALTGLGVDVTNVLPHHRAGPKSNLRGRTVLLPSGGPPIVRQLVYELARTCLVLWWILTGRRFDAWVSRHSLFGVGLWVARFVATDVVLEVNGPVREEVAANYGSKVVAAFFDCLFRIQLRSCTKVVCVSPGLKNYVEERRPSGECVAIANGSEQVSDSSIPWGSRRNRAVFVGALAPWYEVECVVDAVAMLHDEGSDCELLIIGDGARRPKIEARIVERGLGESVELLEWVPAEAAQEEMIRSRVGLVPLRPKSPNTSAVASPLKLYEYAAAGLNLVATDVDGIANSPLREHVESYRLGSVEECAAALRRALNKPEPDYDPELWSWENRAELFLEFLGE